MTQASAFARITRGVLVAALLVAGAAAAPPAGAQQASADEVRRLIRLMGAEAQMKAVYPVLHKQIWVLIDKAVTEIPKNLRDEISNEVLALFDRSTPMFLEAVVPIYRQHFTGQEIRAAIAFYESPAGRSFAQKAPQVTVAAMRAGGAIGRQIGGRAYEHAVKRLREKGYKL